MVQDILRKCDTETDVEDMFDSIQKYCTETHTDLDDALTITDSELLNCKYLKTVFSPNGLALSHYFLHEDESGDFCGLACMRFHKDIEVILEPKYRSIEECGGDIFLMLTQEGTFDVIANNKIIMSGITDFSVVNCLDNYSIIVLNKHKKVSCIVTTTAFRKGVDYFLIDDKTDFISTLMAFIVDDGVKGIYDEMKVSDVMNTFVFSIGELFGLNENYVSAYDFLTKEEFKRLEKDEAIPLIYYKRKELEKKNG